MLSGISQEAQGAVQGVQGSANGALPGYARAAEGFEKTLRNAAAKGSPVLHQRAESAPDNILQTTRRIGGEVDLRLHANRDQLTRSLDAREAEHAQQVSQIRDGFDAFLAETSTQAAGRFNETTTNFESAFDGLAGTVSQAAASWTRPLSVRLAGVIAAKHVEAAAARPSRPRPEGVTGGGAPPKGLTAQQQDEIDFANKRAEPTTLFASRLSETGAQVQTRLEQRAADRYRV